jgi:hypothetical protein
MVTAADSTKHARVHSLLECLLLHCVPSTFVQHVTPRREHLVDPAIESPLLIPPMVGVFAVSFFFSIHRSSSLSDSYPAFTSDLILRGHPNGRLTSNPPTDLAVQGPIRESCRNVCSNSLQKHLTYTVHRTGWHDHASIRVTENAAQTLSMIAKIIAPQKIT